MTSKEDKLSRIGLAIIRVAYTFRSLTPVARHPGIIIHWMGPGRFSEDDRHPGHVVHSIHLQAGYSGIGYHGVVNQDGKYYTGRPYLNLGAHCADKATGYNENEQFGLLWFGGNGGNGKPADVPTPEALETLAKVVAWVCLDQNIPCDRKHIKGHREHLSTACPGTLFDQLDKVVARAKQILQDVNKEPSLAKLDTLRVVIETEKGATEVAGFLLAGKSYVPAAELHRVGVDVEFEKAHPPEREEATLFVHQKDVGP